MEELLHSLAAYGYQVLFAMVFLEAVGFPVPAAIALVISGGAMAEGRMDPALVGASAVGAMLLGDAFMFAVGRYSGWWLLGLLCRVSLNPENCILSSARMFHRRGRIVLLFAKFIPGINTMAPPLAGSMNMPVLQFALLDTGGTLIYIGTWLMVGFVFSDGLEAIKSGFATAGNVVEWVGAAAIVLWLGNRIRLMWTERKLGAAPSAPVELVARMVDEGEAFIFDVRSHGYYDSGAVRITGARRLDPNAMTIALAELPRDKDIFLYCT